MSLFRFKPKTKRKFRYTVKSKGMKNTDHFTLTRARAEKKRRRGAKIYKYKTRIVVR